MARRRTDVQNYIRFEARRRVYDAAMAGAAQAEQIQREAWDAGLTDQELDTAEHARASLLKLAQRLQFSLRAKEGWSSRRQAILPFAPSPAGRARCL